MGREKTAGKVGARGVMEQNFESHPRMVPLYHYFTFSLVLVLLIWSVVRVVTDFSLDRAMVVVLIVAVVMAGYWARAFALGVQDRVIRLEERLRMERLLPDDLRARIGELSTADLIALRFAGDDELADLTRRVLAREFAEPKAIKRAVARWRADHQRI